MTVVMDGTRRTTFAKGTLVTDLAVVTNGAVRTAVTGGILVIDLTVVTKDSSDLKDTDD